jgi:hypothetical protein
MTRSGHCMTFASPASAEKSGRRPKNPIADPPSDRHANMIALEKTNNCPQHGQLLSIFRAAGIRP